MAVRVTKRYRTVREIRPDASCCAECGEVGRTFYDYENSPDENPPAFCNKDCWVGYKMKEHLRPLSSMEDPPEAKEKTDTKRSDPRRPKRRPPAGKPSKVQHLVAVS